MNIIWRVWLGLTLDLMLLASTSAAAPPTVNSLYPAGVQRGQTVEVTVAGTFDTWPPQVWCDRKDVEIKPGKEKGKLTVTAAPEAVPGVCWLRLYDDQGASPLRPLLVGSLPEILEQEPNDDFKKPQTLTAASVTINGRLEKAGDVDCFAVVLRKGQTLVASLEANRTLGSPMDAVVQVLSADGFVQQENHDYHGLDPLVAFTAPKDSTYIVRVFAFPAMPDSSVRFAGGELYIYRLTLTTGAFADRIFPLAVSAAEGGAVELHGWNIPDAAKARAVEKGEPGSDTVVFHPEVTNALAVRLEPHPVIVQSLTNSRKEPQTITLPATVSGRLETRDAVHAYQFEAKKGQQWRFEAEARALGFPLDPVLRLLDGSGKQLAQAESARDGRDPELAFTVPQDGVYRLEVRDLHFAGSPRHLYRVRAVAGRPDFELTLTTDRFTLTPGKPLDVPVTIQRRQGFKEEIELTVEGLPAGVTVATVQTGPAANAKTVTLRLTAEAMPISTAVRVSGKAAGKPETARPVQATIAGLTATTPHVWLTVPSPAK
ncbi:MAG: PPC domain-containing protein [Planctomycetia bacterium]|nr:PPC domain-containing protein [Planctomycetia bacterium]